MKFGELGIIGVGLIGGSFAMAARAAHLAERITGWDEAEVLEEALRRGVIDEVEPPAERGGMTDADLVYLALPVHGIIEFLASHAGRLKRGAIVTDAGSTKREICAAAEHLRERDVHFIGGHPMAGSHKRGLAHARADLFHQAPYAIVDAAAHSYKDGDSAAQERVIDCVLAVGAHPVVITAAEHDRAVAAVSHVPQLLSTALAAVVGDLRGNGASLNLVGTGFAQMTRLAESHWSIWQDICETNGDEIADILGKVIALLDKMRDEMALSSGDDIGAAFQRANSLLRAMAEGDGGDHGGKP